MSCIVPITLIDIYHRSEECFNLEPNHARSFEPYFRTDSKKKMLVPATANEYKVMRCALSFLSTGHFSLKFDDLIYQLAAGTYSADLKNKTMEALAKRCIGQVAFNDVETLNQALEKYDAKSLLPFIACNLLHCPAEQLEDVDVDPDLMDLVHDLRNVALQDRRTDAELTRFEIQTEINQIQSHILAIRNRYESVSNFPESQALSNLLGTFESMNAAYMEYLQEGPSIFGEFISSRAEDYLLKLGSKLGDAGKHLKDLQNLHPEMISDATAQKHIEKLEKQLQKRQAELGELLVSKERPLGFQPVSFMLLPGVEVGYMNGASVLWISPDEIENVLESHVQKMLEVLGVQKLAIGANVYSEDLLLEYYTCRKT